MTAIITSCINPITVFDEKIKSYLNTGERFEQTINTIERLKKYPFNKIYLLDNSHHFDFNALSSKFKDNLIINHFHQYQFENKGINELLLILAIIDQLPDNEPIFKISGRYYPNENFECNIGKGYDFKIRTYDFHSKRGTISTRAYFVANKIIYKKFLLMCLQEVFCYPIRIVGIGSAINAVKQIFKPIITTENYTAIEFAAARVLKQSFNKLEFVNTIGIEGKIAGFEQLEKICE